MSDDTFSIRDLTIADLPAARSLLAQLGYEIAADELALRFNAVRAAGGDHALMVGKSGGAVVALLHIFARPAIEKPAEAIVQSLVVDETLRGQGLGAAMMAHAEDWAQERGFKTIALHTQTHRHDARAFYGKLGYDEIAEAVLVRKPVIDT